MYESTLYFMHRWVLRHVSFEKEVKLMNQKSLYERLGGYDGIATPTNDLLPRLRADPQFILSLNSFSCVLNNFPS
jgi:hypothetical protein